MESQALVVPPYVARPLRLEPFRALMLAPGRVGDPASARAFARPYPDVAARLKRWEKQGQIRRDAEPSLYLHEYTSGGITIRGLVGLIDVSRRANTPAERAVLPHEGIYPARADDLADRMEQMRLNPAPILLVHRGAPETRVLLRQIRKGTPDAAYYDRNRQQHRVWAIRAPELITRVNESLRDSVALIADGHHRYAAYLRLQQRERGGASDLGLAMLVDQADTPLFLGAIHRVFTGTGLADIEAAAATCGGTFGLTDQHQAVASLAPDTLVVTDSKQWGVLRLELPADRAAVELLQQQLVPALPHGPRRITYHHSVEDTLTHVNPEIGTAVLLPAVDADLVIRLAADDRLLPEKATSFQPKPALGVLLRALDDS